MWSLPLRVWYDYDFERNGRKVAREHYANLERVLQRDQRDYLDWCVEDGW